MIIAVPKEIKAEENRVAMTPSGVEVMIQNGHMVLVQKNAGAEIVDGPGEISARSEMVMHLKEPLPPEYDLMISKPATVRRLIKEAEVVNGRVIHRGVAEAFDLPFVSVDTLF
jgi:alanine dehydrogenase